MPPRRSHKKSRAGCRRCKHRKIKCDEVHPHCGNCVKHGVPCDFFHHEFLDEGPSPVADSPKSSTAASLNINLTSPGHTSSRSPLPPTPLPPTPLLPNASPLPLFSQPFAATPPIPSLASSQVDRLMELRLMHQYITVTSKTLLTNTSAAIDIWQRAVPEMAFAGRTYLADAILSVAALHLRSQTPDDKALARASHAYAASTLHEYCTSLNKGITPDNAEALFLTAALIAFQATASRIFVKDDAEEAGDPAGRYALPIAWFHAFQGVKTVVATSWQYIRNSSTVKAIIDSQPSFQLDLNPIGPNSFFGHLLDDIEEEIAHEDAQKAQETSRSYSHAICVLNWAHKSPHPAASLAFPATVTRQFIELVEAKRPRALAILACFFALLKRLDSMWWLHDVSRREVMGLVGLFEPGSKWWRHLEWPIRIAVWDGATIPSEVWGAEWDVGEKPGEGFETMMTHIEMMAHMVSQAGGAAGFPSIPITMEPILIAESPD